MAMKLASVGTLALLMLLCTADTSTNEFIQVDISSRQFIDPDGVNIFLHSFYIIITIIYIGRARLFHGVNVVSLLHKVWIDQFMIS